jgi:hypothetical protein
MFRMAMAVLICLPLAAHAVPLPRDVIPEKPSLEDTEWSGEFEGRAFRYRFDKDGVLRYFSNGDSTSKGKWKQTRESVEFDINDYSFHKATVQGNLLEGTSSNRDGRKWTFRLNRVNK